MALSWASARRVFDKLKLVTDGRGANLACEMGWRYDEVDKRLTDLPHDFPETWALGKLETYATQTEPFFHLDWDAVLWKKPPQRILESRVFAQSWESCEGRNRNRVHDYRIDKVPIIKATKAWVEQQKRGVIDACNMGICGGNDVTFFAQYASDAKAMLFAPENRKVWNKTQGWMANLLLEQWYFAAAARFHNVEIVTLLPDNETPKQARDAGYTHLLSGSKWEPKWIQRVQGRLQKDFPSLFATARRMAA